MSSRKTFAIAALAALGLTSVAFAQPGPIARSCGDDITKLCADKPHDGSVRICLETNYDQLAAACKKSLDASGGGRGKMMMGPNMGKGKGMGKDMTMGKEKAK
jgi:hypothetical protein